MSRQSTLRGIFLWVLLLAAGLALMMAHGILWHEFIREGFEYNGENYFKTEGAVIREHFWRGLFLTLGDPFTFWLILAFVTLSLSPPEKFIHRSLTGITLLYLLMILWYTGTKSYELMNGTFENTERVIAIGGAGIARVIGAMSGGWLAVLLDAFGRLNALLSRSIYQKPAHQLR